MLPLTDHLHARRTPVINYLIIAANVAMFLWELSLGPYLQQVLSQVAFVPQRFNIVSIFVSMFLHGGFLHIGSNMLYLWIFGDNIEDRLGRGRYLLFYLLCGFGATLTHFFFNPGSDVPTIGASGAIAGVLGAYLVLYPKQRVSTLIPIFVFIIIREIPAIFLLGFWFVLQLFAGVGSLGVSEAQMSGGVAYFAHIGGFVLGMILIVIMGGLRRPPQRRPAF
ncbi:MAG TPA: rhomboid family intramembrane serine protease [Thermoanaerobaculia bacterium]